VCQEAPRRTEADRFLQSLNQQLEKNSPTLNRSAVYDETRRIDRLPAYLATHFVRFYWRRDINK